MPQYTNRSVAWLYIAVMLSGVMCCNRSAFAVVGGDIDPNVATSPWAGVGSISVGNAIFSGALIAPRLVLTAAHAVARAQPGNVTFTLNLGPGPGTPLRAEAIFVHPGFRGFRGFHAGSEYDLALIRLRDAAPKGTPIYRIADEPLRQGTVVTFVGYGAAGTGDTGITSPADGKVKRIGQNVADCFAFVPYPGNCGLSMFAGTGSPVLYVFDFDSPDGAIGVFGGPPTSNSRESTLGNGDSGSPAFMATSAGWEIVAVNTFVTRAESNGRLGVFGTVGGGVLVSGEARQWIDRSVPPTPTAEA
ncbi:MAG: trypsin-like peptidase domain-containing protein, partial [Betaproteobacteria bacterium]